MCIQVFIIDKKKWLSMGWERKQKQNKAKTKHKAKQN